MGVVQGSVVLQTPSAGNYQVIMPKADLDVVGFAPIGVDSSGGPIYGGPPIVGVFIDASNIAYFPLPVTDNYTIRKYSPVHVKLKGTVLNINIPYMSPFVAGLTIFYGVPDGSEVEFTSLKGVPFAYANTSTTANASGSLTVTFPSGNVKISGIFAFGLNGAYGQLSFITGTGDVLYIPVSTSPDPMDLPDNIVPLDLESATTLSLDYVISYNSSGNATIYGIIYYV